MASQKPNKNATYANLEPDERQVIVQLQQNKEMLMDELSWKAQIPVSKLASLLLSLELQGLIKALPGKKFMLV